MALTKQPVNFNFSQGLDTKTDPFQLAIGKFLALQNMIFTKGGLLSKRNGYPQLTSLPDLTNTFLTTFNGNLTAIGATLNAYSSGSDTWVNKGNFRPVGLKTLPLIRSNTNQSQCDSAISASGLICTAFTDQVPSSGSNVAQYKYVIADSITGQNIVAPTIISANATGSPRVFIVGSWFVIVFSSTITGTNHLQYLAISVNNPTITSGVVNISSTYTPASTVAFDGVVANNNLYLAWNGSDSGGAVRIAYLTSTLVLSSTVVYSGKVATIMALGTDLSTPIPTIYVAFYDNGSGDAYALGINQNLSPVFSPQLISNAFTILNLTITANAGVATVFYEVSNAYGYDSAIATNYVAKITVTQSGTVGSYGVVARSIGLASKAFFIGSNVYFLGIYDSPYQPTFFLSDINGNITAKLAYSNGGGYLTTGLPNVSVSDVVAQIPYLIKDTIIPANKAQGVSQIAVYSQTGINLCSLSIGQESICSSEIANNLHVSGGFLWSYDGYTPVEQNFHLWPDSVELTASTTGGAMTAQQYFYQVTYEWADNQGNVYRSAPSVPVSVTTTGTTSQVTIDVPTLRLTYKISNPVKIVVYRWSAAQQTYFQINATSILTPVLNDPTVDSIAIIDKALDSAIIGNQILYTTGGVVEDIGPPATNVTTLYKSRLFLVDAEDPNLLWYSKQVIESTPVEMSDLFTIYVAPTTSAQGDTGPMTALSAMDDKLIIFKKDAIYYITGTGPDNTGANNDFSDAVFITSTVGSANQQSIVFIPQGLLFQSDKGIWLLGRDLSTTYIGSPVEAYNSALVLSAVSIPGTNQVRFTLNNGVTLMYDYFYGQWGTFNNVPAISSTLYKSQHTFLDSFGRVFQENPGTYLDGASPVLMAFTTGWLNVAGLQGYERSYFLDILGSYVSPHKLNIQIAYDYNPSPTQQTIIQPNNFSGTYGQDSPYGNQFVYGGQSTLEQWKIDLQRQQCMAFQISITEIFDPFFGTIAGGGFTMSGINCVVGIKKGWRPMPIQNIAG